MCMIVLKFQICSQTYAMELQIEPLHMSQLHDTLQEHVLTMLCMLMRVSCFLQVPLQHEALMLQQNLHSLLRDALLRCIQCDVPDVPLSPYHIEPIVCKPDHSNISKNERWSLEQLPCGRINTAFRYTYIVTPIYSRLCVTQALNTPFLTISVSTLNLTASFDRVTAYASALLAS